MENMKSVLIAEARAIIPSHDPSHDINHALRVLRNAEIIQAREGGDLEVITPAALLHDVVVYPKDHPSSRLSAYESAAVARKLLEEISSYDRSKIDAVEKAIIEHSYSNGHRPTCLESKIVQDADRLEATGAIAIMRTFCSAGVMRKQFYHQDDPFCEKREHECLVYALDLFYSRLMVVKDKMNTMTASRMADERTMFLYDFLSQLKREIR